MGAPETSEWRHFGRDVVGAMVQDGPDGSLYLKLDERAGAGGREVCDWSKNVLFETTWGSDWGHEFVPSKPQTTDA